MEKKIVAELINMWDCSSVILVFIYLFIFNKRLRVPLGYITEDASQCI